MVLISIILGILVDRYWKMLDQWRQFDWYASLNRWVLVKTDQYLHNPTAKFLALLAIPVIVTMLLQQITEDWPILFSLIFAFVVFVYCLGSLELEHLLDNLISSIKSKDNTELDQARLITGETSDKENLIDDVLKVSLNTAMEKLFGVIFWFAILGPVGAVLYRFSVLLQEQYADDPVISRTAERMTFLLNWLPVRFLSFSFAITGHFEGALAAYKENIETDRTQQFLLFDICHGSLEGNAPEDKASYLTAFRGLLLRSLIVWLTCIALLTLLGWS